MTEENYKIFNSVTKIDKKTWDDFFGDIPEGYEFFQAIEESNIREFSLSYIVIYEKGTPVLIAPFFIADFNLDIAIEGALCKIILWLRRFLPRLFVVKTAFCGSPFGENGFIGISPIAKDKPALILKLAEILCWVCRKDKIPLAIFKDFPAKDNPLLDPLVKKGFFRTASLPSVMMELGFSDFEDYLKSLSHNRRKDLRRKLKKAETGNTIEVKITDNVEPVIDDIYRLYLNTYESGRVKFEKLTPQFFIKISEHLINKVLFFLYYVKGNLAAFNLCFLHEGTLIDKFIGFDYERAYKYNLYFYSWCYNVRWCLENGVRYYHVGQTDYYPKLQLGGKLVPLFAYLKHANPFMHFALKILSRLVGPETMNKDQTKNA